MEKISDSVIEEIFCVLLFREYDENCVCVLAGSGTSFQHLL